MNDLIISREISDLQKVEITKDLLETSDFSEHYLALKKTIDDLEKVKKDIDSKISQVIIPLNALDGTVSISSDKLNFTYCAPTTSMAVDSAKLKKDFPEVYKQCLKTTEKKGSLRITERKSSSGETNG